MDPSNDRVLDVSKLQVWAKLWMIQCDHHLLSPCLVFSFVDGWFARWSVSEYSVSQQCTIQYVQGPMDEDTRPQQHRLEDSASPLCSSRLTHAPMCTACQFAKQRCKYIAGSVTRAVPETLNALKADDTFPGSTISQRLLPMQHERLVSYSHNFPSIIVRKTTNLLFLVRFILWHNMVMLYEMVLCM